MDAVGQLMNTVTRAAYRALLDRHPEAAADAASPSPLFDAASEAQVENILREMSESEEFKARRHIVRMQEYPTGTWVLAEVGQQARLWVDLGDLGVSRNCVLGNYEPVETAFLDGIIKPGMTFLDIGANVGWFSIRAAGLVGDKGRVIAIEPRKLTAEYLKRSADENGFSSRVIVHQVALGSSSGQMLIGWSADGANSGGTWSLTTEDLISAFDAGRSTTQPVDVVRLDDLVASERIDVIKIDIEGAEHLAISGGKGIIRRDRPVILSEISPEVMQQVSLVTASEYIADVCALGYRCFYLDGTGLAGEVGSEVVIPEGMDIINVVFEPI